MRAVAPWTSLIRITGFLSHLLTEVIFAKPVNAKSVDTLVLAIPSDPKL